MIYIDFETYSELDVTQVGPHRYAEHESTGVVCLRYAVGDGPIKLWHPFLQTEDGIKEIKKGMPKDLRLAFLYGAEWEAHNAMFEECIWNRVMVLKHGWDKISLDGKNCSAAASARLALPRALEKVGKVLKVSKLKDLEGKRVMLKVAKPRKPTMDDPYSLWHRSPEDLNRVFEYCADDVASEREISKTIPKLTPFEKRVWTLDQKINRKGVFIDLEAVNAAIDLISEHSAKLEKQVIKLTHGEIQTLGQTKKIMEYLKQWDVKIPNLQAQTISDYLLEKGDETKNKGIELLKIRQALSSSSIKKYQAMKTRVCADGRIRDILVYHRASTGRWAGQGLQIQNLPRGSVKGQDEIISLLKQRNLKLFESKYPQVLKALSSCIRGMICAPKGKVIRAFDWNAIEARTLLWLSDCELGLTEFRDNLDPYKRMASAVFDVKELSVTGEQRDLGKRIVLGAGYGMGPPKFKLTCKTQGNLVIPLELAQKGIFTYRNRYKEVPKFWRKLEEAATRCVNTNQTVLVNNKLKFSMHRDGKLSYMTITLPSGRDLFYWFPSIEILETSWGQEREQFHSWYVDSQTKQWVRGGLYGGLFAENCASGVARDVMVDRMLALDDAGHSIIFSVHDEIAFEDGINFSSLDDIKQIISVVPKWAKGLPIRVEGWQDFRYRK